MAGLHLVLWVLPFFEPLFYPGTLIRLAVTDIIYGCAKLPLRERVWLRTEFPMAYAVHEEPAGRLWGFVLSGVVVLVTAAIGALLMLPCMVTRKLNESPGTLLWVGFALGCSVSCSLLPQDPRAPIPLYVFARWLIALCLIAGLSDAMKWL